MIFSSGLCLGQDQLVLNPATEQSVRFGKMYFYWGWNGVGFSRSDINFKGANYDFTLMDIEAKGRQSKFAFNPYFHPGKFTIPQYNFRVGYYLKGGWDISLGMDHMKYVAVQNQMVNITGFIDDTSSAYNGVYENEPIVLSEDFLTFEHTDGLNYINTELRRSARFFKNNWIKIDGLLGLGVGVLVPRTNTTLLGRERYDQFHLSGYGFNAVTGLKLGLVDRFFIQTEFKGGYIDLPTVRTTESEIDTASHSFYFYQINIVFGGVINW